MPVRIKGGFSTVGCQKPCALQLVLLFFLTLSSPLFLKVNVQGLHKTFEQISKNVNFNWAILMQKNGVE